MKMTLSAAIGASLLAAAAGYADWTPCADLWFPTKAHATTYDPVDDRLYVIDGQWDDGTYVPFIMRYDPVANTWTDWMSLSFSPYAVGYFDASYVNGRIYCFGGYNGTNRNYNMIYNIAADSWSSGTALPAARNGGGQVPYNDSLVYMLGGSAGGGVGTTSVYIYNTYTYNWTNGTPLPQEFYLGGVAITGDTIWLVGGVELYNLIYGVINPANCEQIDWHYGQPTQGQYFNGATALRRGGQWYLYLVGGKNGIDPVDSVFEYNVTAETWNALPSYPLAVINLDYLVSREGHDEIYVCGGESGGYALMNVMKLSLVIGTGEQDGQAKELTGLGFAPSTPTIASRFTEISYHTAVRCAVSLGIYDAHGRLVRSLAEREPQAAGWKSKCWDGRDQHRRPAPAGVYFVRLEAGEEAASRKLVVVE